MERGNSAALSYILKLLLLGLVTFTLGGLVIAAVPFDRRGRFAYVCTRLWAWSILKVVGVTLRVEGLERLDPARQYIFMANHQSAVDIPVLVQALPPFQLRWLAKRELLRVPLFGWAVWAAKHILVDRSSRTAAIASLRAAKRRIEDGVSVVVFPEGTRGTRGRLLPFKRGGFILALRARTPIVPLVIQGSGAILPKGDWRLRRGPIEVLVRDPVSLEAYDTEGLGRLVRRVREEMESALGRPADFRAVPEAVRLQVSLGLHGRGYLWSR